MKIKLDNTDIVLTLDDEIVLRHMEIIGDTMEMYQSHTCYYLISLKFYEIYGRTAKDLAEAATMMTHRELELAVETGMKKEYEAFS